MKPKDDKELVENFVMEFTDMMSAFLEDYESYYEVDNIMFDDYDWQDDY